MSAKTEAMFVLEDRVCICPAHTRPHLLSLVERLIGNVPLLITAGHFFYGRSPPVAGSGCPFQVLARYARCGLFTSIPNAKQTYDDVLEVYSVLKASFAELKGL
jgi:hypothetical protein